jgi:hypothetical protein
MFSQENLTTILNVLVPAIVAVAGFIIAWQTEKLRTMREQLSQKKYNAYADAVKMFYSVLKDTKANRTTNNREMMDRIIDIKRDIFMYGSDKVFKAFNKWLLSTTNSNIRRNLPLSWISFLRCERTCVMVKPSSPSMTSF